MVTYGFVKSKNHSPHIKKTRILSVLCHQQLKKHSNKQTTKNRTAVAILCVFREHFMKITASPVPGQFLLVFSMNNSLQYKEKLLNFQLLRLSYWLLFDRCLIASLLLQTLFSSHEKLIYQSLKTRLASEYP